MHPKIKTFTKNLILLLVIYFGADWFVSRHLVGGDSELPRLQLLEPAASTAAAQSTPGVDPVLENKAKWAAGPVLPATGKNSVVYIWATWCGVCKTNLHILPNKDQSPNTDYYMVVSDRENFSLAQKMLAEHNIQWPLYTARSLNKWRVNGYPTTYFVNAQGRVAAATTGLLSPMGLWLREMWMRFTS